MEKKVNNPIIRFAPSLSGNIHLGNLRVLFYNWLFFKKNGGNLILRIENSNSKDDLTNLFPILECMEDFKLHWTNGPLLGNSKLYFQFKRCQIYLYYLRRLCILGLASHLIKSKAIVLNLTKFYTKLGYYNFIIYRGNSKPVFNFVNPIDDIDFKISHVIRGEDHIANLEKHTLFFKIFKQLNPQYIHVPLLLNPFNLNKLSKKNKMFSIKRFLERGILEESILNLLFLQGKNIFLNFLTIDQMINFFSLKKIGVKNSTVDIKKLYFLNKKHIQNITNNYYLFRIKNFLKKKKIFQLKSLRENNPLYLILKNNIKQLYIISNLFLNEFLTPKKCSFCFKMLILNTKLISVSKLEINRIDFKNKNFKFIRVFLTGVEIGLPVIVLLKFYNKMRLYNNKTRV